MRTAIISATLGLSLTLAPVAIMAPAASAATHADKVVSLTRAELRELGFPRQPNTVNWGKGTAEVTPHKAGMNEPVTITGKAPKFVKPGTVLVMGRFLPKNKQGDGSFQTLDLITATVKADRTFTMIANLGRPGLWGYRVGYLTDGDNPEFIGFQFQLRTTTTPTADAGSTDS